MDTSQASLASNPPPTSGEWYWHDDYGRVKLIKPGGGYSWHCSIFGQPNHRLILSPKKMRRIDPP